MIGIQWTTLLALAALAFPAVSLHAEDRMRAGLWEVTNTLDGKLSAGGATTTCYTPAMVQMANAPAQTLRETAEKASARTGCTFKEYKQEGKSISMVKVCGGKTLAISSTYSGDAFETVITSKEAGVSVTRMKGKRIGDCK